MWVLGIKLRSFGRAASALNHQAITLASKLLKLYIKKVHIPLFKWKERYISKCMFWKCMYIGKTSNYSFCRSLNCGKQSKFGRSENWSSHFFLNGPWQPVLRASSNHPWTLHLSSFLAGREGCTQPREAEELCWFKSRHE